MAELPDFGIKKKPRLYGHVCVCRTVWALATFLKDLSTPYILKIITVD